MDYVVFSGVRVYVYQLNSHFVIALGLEPWFLDVLCCFSEP